MDSATKMTPNKARKKYSNMKATVNVGIQARSHKTYSEMKVEDRMKKIRMNTITEKQTSSQFKSQHKSTYCER